MGLSQGFFNLSSRKSFPNDYPGSRSLQKQKRDPGSVLGKTVRDNTLLKILKPLKIHLH